MAPKGYEPIKPSKDIDLDGKEVYLAQIPSDFDIKKAVIKSDTEVIYNGVSYFMMSSSALNNCDILTASKDGKLRPSSTKVTGLLAFTQQVPKVKVDHEKEAQPKPLVKQKEHLRMRHFPTGYGPKSYGVDTTPIESKKRTEDEMDTDSANRKDTDELKPQKKKHKKDKSEKSDKKKKSDKKADKKSSRS